MDDTHQRQLERILADRKKGGRLLYAPNSSQQQKSNALPSPIPTASRNEPAILTPHSPNQPTFATRNVNDSVGSGAIVIEEERPQKTASTPTVSNATLSNNNNAAKSTSSNYLMNNNNNNNPYRVTTDVTSTTTVTRPANNQQDVQEMERVRRQNEEQTRQIEQLQRSLEQMQQQQRNNNQPQNANNGSYNFSPSTTITNNNNNNNNNNNTKSNIRPPPQRNDNHNNNNTYNDNNAVEQNFQQAASIGLFVKPQRVISDGGSRYITFKSPSRNQRGSLAQTRVASPDRHLSSSMSSPNNQNNFNNKNQSSRSLGGNKSALNNTHRRNNNNNQADDYENNNNNNNSSSSYFAPAGVISSPRANSTSSPSRGGGGAAAPTMMGKRSLMPRPSGGGDDRIPKPFSSSTLDTNSAMLLLSTGNFFYKLRVHVKSASVVGPAGWDIETWERRWVYLDTNTYMLKWGDKPGGSATVFSHYVPIDDIVKVDMYNQTDPNFGGDGPRVIYYIVMNIVEGGFNARGRGVNKRMCVIATELRDKADMWYDALQSIGSFYRSQRASTKLNAKTFSSD